MAVTFPALVYKGGGQYLAPGGYYDYKQVADQTAYDAALATGWKASLSEVVTNPYGMLPDPTRTAPGTILSQDGVEYICDGVNWDALSIKDYTDATLPDPASLPVGAVIDVSGDAYTKTGGKLVNENTGTSSDAITFRAMGGKVAAYYYGEWSASGMSYNRHPWRWLEKHQNRLPMVSVPMPSKLLTHFKGQFSGGVSANSITYGSNYARLTATGASPYYYTTDMTRSADYTVQLAGGKSTGSNSTSTLNDATKLWSASQFVGCFVKIVGGTGSNQVRQVSANTATGLTIFPNWATTPDATSVYQITNQAVEYASASDYSKVRVRYRMVTPGTTWNGRVLFQKVSDQTWTGPKAISFSAPGTFSTSFDEVIVDMSGNSEWTGDITKLRIDFYTDSTQVVDLFEIELIPTSKYAISVQSNTIGLPSDQQWAVDWEIMEASKYGIDMFIQEVFWEKNAYSTQNSNFLDQNLQLHFNSTVSNSFQNGVLWVNSSATNPFQSKSDWYAFLDYLYPYMSSSKFFRINNKPAIWIYSVSNLMTWASTLYTGYANQRLAVAAMISDANAYLAAKSSSTTPDGVFWIGNGAIDNPSYSGNNTLTPGGTWIGYHAECGFGAISRYNGFTAATGQYIDNSGGGSTGVYPADGISTLNYDKHIEVYRQAADWYYNESGNPLPLLNPIMAGWAGAPWINYNFRVTPYDFEGNFPYMYTSLGGGALFEKHLVDQLQMIVENSELYQTSSVAPVVCIYAWNEYAEGGYIVPNRGDGWAKLETIKKVFG